MNNHLLSIFLAFGSGLFGAVQGTINSQIGKNTSQFAMIIGVSLAQAFFASIFLFRGGPKAFTMISSPWMVVAGILGVVIMFGVSVSIQSIGTLSVFLLVLLGQIIASTLIDHFSLFGSLQIPITPQKIGSILVILLGVLGLLKS